MPSGAKKVCICCSKIDPDAHRDDDERNGASVNWRVERFGLFDRRLIAGTWHFVQQSHTVRDTGSRSSKRRTLDLRLQKANSNGD